MARVSSIVTNFQAGELSPRLEGRIDLQKYSAGAQTLQNMVVFPQGGVTRRPGTQYAATSKDGGKVRLINFEFSDEQAYVLEFGANYIRFFKDGALLTILSVNSSRNPQSISSITKANPAVVTVPLQTAVNISNIQQITPLKIETSSAHNFVTGDMIFFDSLVGATELNDDVFFIEVLDSTSFRLYTDRALSNGVSDLNVSAYVSGGTAQLTHGLEDGDRIIISSVEGMTELNNREFRVAIRHQYDISNITSGELTVGETITGGTSGATGKVVSYTPGSPGTIILEDVVGVFNLGALDPITGGTSGGSGFLDGDSKEVQNAFALREIDNTDLNTSSFGTHTSSTGNVGRIVEIATTYTEAEVFQLNHAQSADVLYLANKNHPPAKLTRTTATSFTLSDIDFIDGPYLDENITNVTIFATNDSGTTHLVASAGSESFLSGNPVTFVYDGSDIFSSDNIGQLWRFREVIEEHYDQWEAGTTNYADGVIVHYNGNVYKQTTGSSQAPGNSPPVHLSGAVSYNNGAIQWTYQHSGTGYVEIESLNKEVICVTSSKSGTFQLGETITGGTSGATASYIFDKSFPDVTAKTFLFMHNISGSFIRNETLTGGTSGATINIDLYSDVQDSPMCVKATVKNATGVLPDHVVGSDDATTKWSEGAFSIGNGYPRAVAFYEERLFFAGTTNNPQTIFGSVTADFENHEPGTEDDKAINITIASDQVNVIKHMIPGRFLQIMTSSAEFTLSGGTGTTAVTPTNVNVLRETTFGSGDVRPLRAGASTIMIQKGGEKVKEVTFSLDTDGLVGRDLTVLGEHLARSGLTDMVWQQEPELILWFVRGDGTLIGLSYDPANNTIGWHQHPLGGSGVVESITAIPSGVEDQVYMSVKRTINSETVRHIVFMKPIYFDEDLTKAFYVDSGLTFTGTAVGSTALTFPVTDTFTGLFFVTDGRVFPSGGGKLKINNEIISYSSRSTTTVQVTARGVDGTTASAHSSGSTITDITPTTITGLNHLEGETVQIAADGAAQTQKTVSGGSITTDSPVAKAHIGYGYDSIVETMRMEAGADDGIAQGKIKRIHGVTIRFLDTFGADVGPDTSNLDSISFDAGVLFSGDKEINFPSGYENEARIVVRQNEPLPMSIIAIMRRSNTFDA